MQTLRLGPGVSLLVDDEVAASLRRQLDADDPHQGAPSPGEGMDSQNSNRLLGDDHPLWDRHTGLEGHRGQEWRYPHDKDLAEAFYASVRGKAKVFLDLLMNHAGELLDVDDICRLRPDDFSGSRSIAGALNGLRNAHLASGRRYPFYWWAGTPTKYAMKPLVGDLFQEARSRLES